MGVPPSPALLYNVSNATNCPPFRVIISSISPLIKDWRPVMSAIVALLVIYNKDATYMPLSTLCKETDQDKEGNPTYERIITVKLYCKGVCQSSADNLDLGATQYYVRRSGQLIYGKQNFHNGAIGIVPVNLDKGLTSKDIPSFDIDESICNPSYLLYYLQYPSFYKSTEALTTGSGSKRLKERDFLKIHISLPSKKEQDEIASFLTKLSGKITNEVLILDNYNKQRSYLLSQMFI